ncbi:MAG: hypothetical protein CVU09_11480 [Bacteroidetes bacterium HGW-Bacteroidetes-4]|jgi:subfamily B ATP-binding cassette protein MsbA|nr:MAG: hypothetical protein CVU09_11480 [Bacteroidetes bacterium HGW-Bacteroidetes-4]
MSSNSKRLLSYIAKQKRWIGYGILATLFMSLTELATGGLLKFLTNQLGKIQNQLIDKADSLIKLPLKYNVKIPISNEKITLFDTTLKGADGIFWGLVGLCGIFLLFYLFNSLFNYFRRVYMNAATQRILQNFKDDIYQKLLHLPHAFFSKNPTGDLVSRITYDVTTLNEIIDLLIEVARAAIYILVFIPVMFYLSWQLSLFTLLFFPISVVFINLITHHIKRVSKNITDNVGDYTAFLEKRINQQKLIKTFNKEKTEQTTFSDLIETNFQYNFRLIKLRFSLNPTNDFLGMILLSVVYIFFSYKITHGNTSLGDVVLYLYLVKTVYKPVKKVAEAWGRLHVALVSTRKIFRLLDEAEEDKSEQNKQSLNNIKTIEFRDLSFTYPGSDQAVFTNLNLRVKQGDRISVNGKTGVGKTTLLNLLASFYAPGQGNIYLNNMPLSDYSLSSLRANIILVDGQSAFFDGSVMDNLTYSGKDISAVSLASYANFLGFSNSSDLYQQIGNKGIELSMGQKQKLAFLRALVAQPQVLILDEIFSSLDAKDIEFIFTSCKTIPIVFMVSRSNKVLDYANLKFTMEL